VPRSGSTLPTDLRLRRAEPRDVAALEELIARSGRGLSAPYYTPDQAEAITRHVFGVDTQLIADATYFAVESGGRLVACGGWSRRRTLYGSDRAKEGPDPLLDPAVDPARIRAFFVDPAMARQGLGRRLLAECVEEARAAGFAALELVSTLPGEPLYRASGFLVLERFELELPGGVRVPLARMWREI
jgi:GNAT superfamily N-acetyltransferase